MRKEKIIRLLVVLILSITTFVFLENNSFSVKESKNEKIINRDDFADYEKIDINQSKMNDSYIYETSKDKSGFSASSSDVDVFVIDEDGKITGTGKGLAFIEMSWEGDYGTVTYSYPVVVGMTDKEMLDTIIASIDVEDNNFELRYDSKNEQLTDEFMRNRLAGTVDSNIYAGHEYGLQINVTITSEGNFTYYLQKNDVVSNSRTATYTIVDERENWQIWFNNSDVVFVNVGAQAPTVWNTMPDDIVFESSPFSSSDTNVFTVNDQGTVTGVGEGVATLIATGASGQTSRKCIVVGLSLKDILDRLIDEQGNFTVVISYDSATEELDLENRLKNHFEGSLWLNGSRIDAEAKIVSIENGQVEFYYEKGDAKSKHRTVSYEVQDARTSWSIDLGINYNDVFIVQKGETKKLPFSTYPEDIEFESNPFSSSDPSIFTVDINGNVTGVKKGLATVIGVGGDGWRRNASVLVGYSNKLEFINELLGQINYDNLEIQYSESDEDEIKQAIRGRIYEFLGEDSASWINSILDVNNMVVTKGNNNSYTFKVVADDLTTNTFNGSYVKRGIYVNSYEVHLNIGSTHDLKLAFTEGDIYNLLRDYRDLNGNPIEIGPNIAESNDEGIITAKDNGTVVIYFEDAYGNYSAAVKVVVGTGGEAEHSVQEIQEHWQQFFDGNTVEVVFGIDNYQSVDNYGESEPDAVVENTIRSYMEERGFDAYNYGMNSEINCNYETSKCIYKIKDWGENGEVTVFSWTVNVKFRGLLNHSRLEFINVGGTFKPDLTVFEENATIKTLVLNPLVCSVSNDGTITGITNGVCQVGYYIGNDENPDYVTKQDVVIGVNSLIAARENLLNGINTNITVPYSNINDISGGERYYIEQFILGYVFRNVSNHFTHVNSTSAYLENYYKVNDSEIITETDYVFSEDGNSITITPSYKYCLETSESQYYDYGRNDCEWVEVLEYEPIEFTITYTGANNTNEMEILKNGLRGIASREPENMLIAYSDKPDYDVYLDTRDDEEWEHILTQAGFMDRLHDVCADCTLAYPNIGWASGASRGANALTFGRTVTVIKDNQPIMAFDVDVRFFKDQTMYTRKSLEPGYTYSVTDIELSNDNVGLTVAGTETITATVVPENASHKQLTWSSDDTAIATVDQNGKITGISAGSTTVKVRSHDTLTEKTITVVVAATDNPINPDPEEPEEPEQIPVYRMFNPINGEHLYTKDAYEVKVIYETQGWGFEGIGWYTSNTGTPVYRLYQPQLGNHLYTSDTYEIFVITNFQGWVMDFDGAPVMYSNGDVPIYRLFNPGLQGQHHLTTDLNEYNVIPAWGWQQEGISMNALSKGVPITTYYYKDSHKPIDFENIGNNVLH